MMTVDGLFGAGDTLGGTLQILVWILYGRALGWKAANKYVDDLGSNPRSK